MKVRSLRITYPEAFHHITSRSNERKAYDYGLEKVMGKIDRVIKLSSV